MKSKTTSSFQRNFLFNTCMNQSPTQNKLQQLQPKPTLKDFKKINSSKTLGKPLSMQNLHLNKKAKITNNLELCSPFQQILKSQKREPQSINPSLTNSFHVHQNQVLSYDNLVQSQYSRKSRYEGNKIKIFSNDNSKGSINIYQDRGKSMSRQSHGTSANRQKRGIQVTKTLIKKISGMYSTQDFGKSSQPISARSSHYQKSIQKHEQDSFHNQTGFMMTTLDRTTQEYQLSRDYDSVNSQTRIYNFGLATYGTVNVLNSSYESNRMVKDFPRNSFNYSMNEIAEYSMRQDAGQVSNSAVENRGMAPINFYSSQSIKKVENPVLVKKQGVPLPLEYQQSHQRPSYHLTIKPSQNSQKRLTSSISKGKMFTKLSQSKIFSSTNHSSAHRSPQKNSLVFSKSKEFHKMTTNVQRKNVLFETAHEIFSQEVSSIKQPFHFSQSKKQFSGEELTNMLYGNKDINLGKGSTAMDEKEREKYLIRYKNKTLDDMSVKNSMVEGDIATINEGQYKIN